MSRYQTKSFSFLSLFILCFWGQEVLGQAGRGVRVSIGDEPVADSTPGRAIFRSNVEFGDQKLNLLLILKIMPDDSYKVALINELGMGLMNATVIRKGNKRALLIREIHPLLDKKPLVRKLKKKIILKARQWEIDDKAKP